MPASTSTTGTAPERREDPATLVKDCDALLARVTRILGEGPAAPPAGLLLDAITCRQLDDQLGIGATLTATALVKAVDRLGSMRIGDIRIPFTPGQLAELQHRAQKRGRTVEAEMRAVVARIEEEIFYKGGG
jgi:hypothetical protein